MPPKSFILRKNFILVYEKKKGSHKQTTKQIKNQNKNLHAAPRHVCSLNVFSTGKIYTENTFNFIMYNEW